MNETYLETGKIVSTHGIKGEVKVLPWADAPEFLTRFKNFYLVGAANGRQPEAKGSPVCGRPMAAPTSLTVESARVQKTCVLLKFKGIDTVEDAQKLREQVLCIARDDPHIPAGTVFHADLIGMPVHANGVEIGKIKEILSMPSADVWVVKGKKEYMIPHVRAFVPELDLTRGHIDVNLIAGMETDEN